MKTSDFDYQLPRELIAQKPAHKRDHSRLMFIDRQTGEPEHKHFRDIINYLRPGDLIVKNSSKVIPARLYGKRKTGGAVEVLLLAPEGNETWTALIKPGGRIKPDEIIELPAGAGVQFLGWDNGIAHVKLINITDIYEYMDKNGHTPYPPYIAADENLRDRYQTIYAKQPGSVAAPTAGLHFTSELMQELEDMGIVFADVTLHVGLGTFQPVSVENVLDHKMHSEHYEVMSKDADKINDAIKNKRRIIAIGTTSVRVLESIAYKAGKTYMVEAGKGETDIFIKPGYKFKIIDGLLTNFHLPKSTLLMLVSALAGREKIMQAYQNAVTEKYRFYSFGDAMLIV